MAVNIHRFERQNRQITSATLSGKHHPWQLLANNWSTVTAVPGIKQPPTHWSGFEGWCRKQQHETQLNSERKTVENRVINRWRVMAFRTKRDIFFIIVKPLSFEVLRVTQDLQLWAQWDGNSSKWSALVWSHFRLLFHQNDYWRSEGSKQLK